MRPLIRKRPSGKQQLPWSWGPRAVSHSGLKFETHIATHVSIRVLDVNSEALTVLRRILESTEVHAEPRPAPGSSDTQFGAPLSSPSRSPFITVITITMNAIIISSPSLPPAPLAPPPAPSTLSRLPSPSSSPPSPPWLESQSKLPSSLIWIITIAP